MAQYYTDFSEYDTGFFPQDDWSTVVVEDGDTYEIRLEEEATGGQIVYHEQPSFFNNEIIAWDVAGGSDIEILTKNLRGNDDSIFIPVCRLQSNGEGYGLRLDDDDSRLRIVFEESGGTTDAIASEIIEGVPLATEEHFRRFRVNGNELKGKAWGVNEDEPSDYQLIASDSRLSTGQTGVKSRASSGSFGELDIFTAGTEGDSAPSEPVSGDEPPEPPENLTAELL